MDDDCPHRTLVGITNGFGDWIWQCARCDEAFADRDKTPLTVPDRLT